MIKEAEKERCRRERAAARAEGRKKMNKDYIKKLIYVYGIIDEGDGRIRVLNTDRLTESKLDEIKAAKQDILTFFQERNAQHEEELAQVRREMAVFDALPGVAEVREVERAWEDYHDAFDRMMASGDGIMTEQVPSIRIEEVKSRYPNAAWALAINSERYSLNAEIADIADRAFQRVVSGEDLEIVKAAYEAEKNEFVFKHVWD